LHTHRTDGALSVREHFDFAQENGVERLIFLEHIRRTPTYDVQALVRRIHEERDSRGIDAVVGFETKLLPDGTLDIDPMHAKTASVIGIAEHGFPGDKATLRRSFHRAVARYAKDFETKTLVWVHPGLWFRKAGFDLMVDSDFAAMLRYALEAGVMIEMNLRYALLPLALMQAVPSGLAVIGADAHTYSDLIRWCKVEARGVRTSQKSVPSITLKNRTV
jgi:histidinol phosphatase-like PHP family hydrolase